jgi:hypothetical protein
MMMMMSMTTADGRCHGILSAVKRAAAVVDVAVRLLVDLFAVQNCGSDSFFAGQRDEDDRSSGLQS